jgi:hypothetical protein
MLVIELRIVVIALGTGRPDVAVKTNEKDVNGLPPSPNEDEASTVRLSQTPRNGGMLMETVGKRAIAGLCAVRSVVVDLLNAKQEAAECTVESHFARIVALSKVNESPGTGNLMFVDQGGNCA